MTYLLPCQEPCTSKTCFGVPFYNKSSTVFYLLDRSYNFNDWSPSWGLWSKFSLRTCFDPVHKINAQAGSGRCFFSNSLLVSSLIFPSPLLALHPLPLSLLTWYICRPSLVLFSFLVSLIILLCCNLGFNSSTLVRL